MVRASVRSRVVGLALLLAWCAAALAGAPPEPAEKRDLDLHVVVLTASGRAAKPQFDARAPSEVRRQLEGLNLAYGKYDLVSNQRRGARFGIEVVFDLPDRESLAIKPTADDERPTRLRLGCRVLDGAKKPILVSPMRVSYDKTFFLHRLKGGSGVLMGVSAHKPGDPAPKP